MSDVVEQVTLRAFVECIGCSRKLDTSETLPGDSVRTGNHTQTARYWLDGMGQRIIGSAKARKWERVEKGWRCAHCTAAEVDALGTSVSLRAGAQPEHSREPRAPMFDVPCVSPTTQDWLDMLAEYRHRAERAEYFQVRAVRALEAIDRWVDRRPTLPPEE